MANRHSGSPCGIEQVAQDTASVAGSEFTATIIGGGPGGLYLALLIKRARADARVRVVEQNAANATFGFGVVFSDRALDFLHDGDPEIAALILAHAERWPDLRIVHRDVVVRVDANGFAAVGRLQLRQGWQKVCADGGVDRGFSQRADDLNMYAQSDLLVGADGVNSTLRTIFAERFQPRVDNLTNKFIWYGTRQPFDSLTLTFRHNKAGAFVAHHYRYAPDMSTFIVECDAPTWIRAGFDHMDEAATKAYCETLFAPDLGGHRLISNASFWRNFPILSCAQWQYDNMALIGDAVRTAHFSIGSGTRLALEDAQTLARILQEHEWQVRAALPAYEASRRPVAEKVLRGARGSAQWYEAFASKMHLAPLDLAYDYMTRSGRMSADRLASVAPHFASLYQRAGRN